MNYYIKYNHSNHPQSLLAEAQGLQLLKKWIEHTQAQIKLPDVVDVNEQRLTLTKIISCHPSTIQQQQFGTQLAQLHLAKNNFCGLDTDNFIGLNQQKNIISDHWGEFFWTYRLKFQVDMIRDDCIRNEFDAILLKCQNKLVEWLNQHCSHFSILHGDLWSGNVMFDHDYVWLIDPAVYFGDSETDIAMTEMFGGFSDEFYQSYQTVKPLTRVYPQKRTIYNLYHNLNHYNLFGSSYLFSCKQGMQFINQGFA